MKISIIYLSAPYNVACSSEAQNASAAEHITLHNTTTTNTFKNIATKVPDFKNPNQGAQQNNINQTIAKNSTLATLDNKGSSASNSTQKSRANRFIIVDIGIAGAAVGAAAVGGAALAAGTAAAVGAAAHHIGRHEIEKQKAAGTWKEPKAFSNRYATKSKTESVQSTKTVPNPQISVRTSTCTTDLPKPTYPAVPEPNPDNSYPKNPDNIVVPKPFEPQNDGYNEKPAKPQNTGYNEKPAEPQNDGLKHCCGATCVFSIE
ncbi:hypothetical protein BB561_004171 [Smittium simulii]|uniref:Uncharacterized protein n=1 Tax=Smittium simulii TaxID=133385 RepID=A0A2T9YHR7_9FUNG|nr:hypothetical protein BB561_004171 [Smittium simulii]